MNFHLGNWSEPIEIKEQGLAEEFDTETYKITGQITVKNEYIKTIKSTDVPGYWVVKEEELKELMDATQKLNTIGELQAQLYVLQNKLNWLSNRTKAANNTRTLQKKNRMEICHKYKEEGLSAQEIADKTGIGLSTVYRLLKQYEKGGR